ncbi:hypothetical protein BJX63DRAFT_403057 [Aspergillus granulosus]|uniref:Zn(2)-C6 fungal-type domain-containing protein n=1 Tax=Aspergillus granulosus TaxID=176169 RepID=A0ABR4H3Z6_9EURO
MPKDRRTRSRTGCTQCVRVSIKCNEGRPMCQRCVRLAFACDYSTRFIWKPHKPPKPPKSVVRSKPPITTSDCGVCACPGRLTETQLYNLFVMDGNRLLHWASPSQSDLVGKIARLYHQSPVVRLNIEALMSLLNECCGLSSLTRIDLAISQTKEFFGSDSSHVDQDVLAISMILLSQVAMRAGYTWTHHIAEILPLAVRLSSDNIHSATSDPHSLLEILGGLDMDAWIVGRRSEPLHVWTTWCMGRQGIESITGLPRPLLDLIARVSRNEDVSAELRQFITLLPLPQRQSYQESLWRCFAVTALLHLQSRVSPVGGVDVLTTQLVDLLRYLHATLAWKGNHNVLAWPAFTLGIHVQDNSLGGMTVVNEILSLVFAQSDEGWRHPDGCMRALMNQFWEERERIGRKSAYHNLQGTAFEVGLW